MATEDFTTYTKVDPNSRIVVSGNSVTGTALARNESAYVYKDYGAGHFGGNFYHESEIKGTTNTGQGFISFEVLANAIGDLQALITANESCIGARIYMVLAGVAQFMVFESDAGAIYSSGAYNGVSGTLYYTRFVRDESVGTHGTLYLFIYSDAARTVLLATLSVALHTSKKDYRYLYAAQTYNTGVAQSMNTIHQNLNINTPKIYLNCMVMTAMTMKGALN